MAAVDRPTARRPASRSTRQYSASDRTAKSPHSEPNKQIAAQIAQPKRYQFAQRCGELGHARQRHLRDKSERKNCKKRAKPADTDHCRGQLRLRFIGLQTIRSLRERQRGIVIGLTMAMSAAQT